MRIALIIPAHNEEEHLVKCLQSIVKQTNIPSELIIVDDNSTDGTYAVANKYAQEYPWIRCVKHKSSKAHLPGSKVVQAFNYGREQLDTVYDLIGKFDADIILPENYFECMIRNFRDHPDLGMCSGVLYIKKKGEWIYENIAKKSHVRGPIKLYKKALFDKMNGLREGVGWDTVDTLLCAFHGYQTHVVESLIVKHLRPTGMGYSSQKFEQKGEALYKMRYGWPLANLALFKMAIQARNPLIFFSGIIGYFKSWISVKERYVTPEQGKFIRNLRWKGVLSSVF